MTPELTKAAQRPAAQTELEAFEAEMRCEETWGHRSLKKRPDGRYQNWQVDVMWDVWQARASLTAPQQATPDHVPDAGKMVQATPEPLAEHADHIPEIAARLRLVAKLAGCAEAVPEDDLTAVGCIFSVLGNMRRALELKQATPEPVGEPAAWRWFNSNGDQVTNWLDFKAAQKAKVEAQVAEAGGRIEYAYTGPAAAPAVPDDTALLDYLDTLATRPAGSDLHCFGGRVVLYVRTGIGSQVEASGAGTAREAIRAAMLAAAQAKGVQA